MSIKKKSISLAVILVVFSVLAAILTITTYRDIQKEKEYVFESLKTKGVTLAYSLQASTVLNVSNLEKDTTFLQKLITKASKEQDIAYIALVDEKGLILAHTYKGLVGKSLPFELGDKKYIKKNKINPRLVPSSLTKKKVLEVIEPFIFVPSPTYLTDTTSVPGKESTTTIPKYSIIAQPPEMFWWVIGFKIERAIFATKAALHKAIGTGLLLLVLGSAALYIILTLQKYYLIKQTLANTTSSVGQILSSMSSGVVFVNDYGKIITFNSAAEKITGFKEKEVKGKPYTEVFSSGEASDLLILSALNKGYSCYDKNVHRIVKGGRKLPFKESVFPLYDQDGKIIGAGEIFQDLQMIRELEERVRRADRLASLGKLAAGMAHEVRNPLASIKGFAQYLKRKFPSKESGSQYADIIIEEVERLNRIISALLNFAKPNPLHIGMHNINSIIENCVALVEDEAGMNHISIVKNLEAELPLIPVDKEQIKQVLLNIFLNAIQEMEGGGKLEITSRADEDSFITVDIEDTGRGIPPENIQDIFSPFFTTKESGFGLGLSIASTIIESHGGEIKVRSEIEKGTTFTILIPLDHGKMSVGG